MTDSSSGSLDAAFAEAKTTARVSFGQMRAAMEVLLIAVGDFVNLVGGSGVFDFLKEIFVELSGVVNTVGKDMDETRSIAETFVGAFKVVGFVVAAGIDVFRKMTIPINALSRTLLRAQIVLVDMKFDLERWKLEAVGATAAADGLGLAQKIITDGMRSQIHALGEAIEKTIEQRTAVEVFGDIVERVEAKLKRQREETARAARAAAEYKEALRGMGMMFGDVVAPAADETERAMAFMRENLSKLSVEMQEFVIDGGDAEEMLRRFGAEFAKIKPEDKTGDMDSFADSVRAAMAELEKGPQTATAMADALQGLPKTAQDFVIAAGGVDQMNTALKQTQAELKATEERARITNNVIRQFAGAVADFVGRVLDAAFEGQIKTMKDVGKIAQDVLKSLLKSVIQQLVQLAVQAAVTRAIAGAATGAIVQGGVVGSNGGSVPAFATGGVITGPGLFIAGEGGNNEAIVPLPDGRSIPVQMEGGGGAGGGGSVTNVFNVSAVDEAGVAQFFQRRAAQDALKGGVVNGMRTDSSFRKEMNGPMG